VCVVFVGVDVEVVWVGEAGGEFLGRGGRGVGVQACEVGDGGWRAGGGWGGGLPEGFAVHDVCHGAHRARRACVGRGRGVRTVGGCGCEIAVLFRIDGGLETAACTDCARGQGRG